MSNKTQNINNLTLVEVKILLRDYEQKKTVNLDVNRNIENVFVVQGYTHDTPGNVTAFKPPFEIKPYWNPVHSYYNSKGYIKTKKGYSTVLKKYYGYYFKDEKTAIDYYNLLIQQEILKYQDLIDTLKNKIIPNGN